MFRIYLKGLKDIPTWTKMNLIMVTLIPVSGEDLGEHDSQVERSYGKALEYWW